VRTVQLLRRTPDAETEPLARITATSPGMPVEIEILIPEFREGLELLGVGGTIPDDQGQPTTPHDGERYLDALLAHYRGSRLWAREVPPEGE
jgi:hypothetical protein